MKNEDDFQKWVMARLMAYGNYLPCHFQDFSGMDRDVPDLNWTAMSQEFWVELKFDRFRLGRNKYDQFKWSKLQRAQLQWLMERERAGAMYCGILGYASVYGDTDNGVGYLVYHPAHQYMAQHWHGKFSIGSVILNNAYSIAFDQVKNGSDLMEFISRATLPTARSAPGRFRNGG